MDNAYMKTQTMRVSLVLGFAAALLMGALMAGCSTGKQRQWFRLKPTTTQPVPKGEIPPEAEIDAGSELTVTRFLSWFGLGAGDTLSKMNPTELTYGRFGIKSKGMKGGILDILRARLQTLLFTLGLGGAGLLALWLIPATRPVAQLFLTGIAWLLPFVGGLVERLVGKHKLVEQEATQQRILTDTVATVQDGRKALADAGMADALAKFDSWLAQQTPETQVAVAQAKDLAGVISATDKR